MRSVIALEPWEACADEAQALGAAHFGEVNDDARRPYKLDRALMTMLAFSGALVVITARLGGTLIGYALWTVQRDPESSDLLIAEQGPWFVEPDHVGVGMATWKRSLAELKRVGVKMLNLHHHFQGRGSSLKRFYERQGGVHVKEVYQFWIGD